MKTTALALAAAALAFAGSTHAAPAATEAPPPRYGALAAGTPTFLPRKAPPAAIGGKERAPGFFPIAEDSNQETTMILGFPPSERGDTPGLPPPSGARACLAQATPDVLAELRAPHGDGVSKEWLEMRQLDWNAQAFRRSKDFPQGGVTAVHLERFEDGSGQPALVMADAWVDPVTRGARKITEQRLPLTLLGESAQGVRVFAARDDRSASDRRLQVILVPDPARRTALHSELLGVRNGSDMVQSSCGHLRVDLAVTDEGASAVMTSPLVVRREQTEASGRGLGRRGGLGLGPGGSEITVRTLATQVSVSRTTRDAEPVLSVSFGWVGREENLREP